MRIFLLKKKKRNPLTKHFSRTSQHVVRWQNEWWYLLVPSPPSRSQPPPPVPLCAQRRRPLWTWEGAAKKGCRQCEAFPALFLLLPHGAPGWRDEHTWTGNPETWFQGGSLCTLPVSIGQFAFSGNHFFIQPTESWVATCWPEQLSSWGQSSIRLLQPSAGAGGLCVGLRGPSSCLSLFPFEILA